MKLHSWRVQNERLASLVSQGVCEVGIMLTVTLSCVEGLSAMRLHSVLTSLGSRLRRAGLLIRVTAREFGTLRGRLHWHMWVSGELETLYTFAVEHWRGFRGYAEGWVPDEGARRAQWLQQLYVSGNWKGRGRPHEARGDHELIMGRYLAGIAGTGYIDVQGVGSVIAVGYLLSYVGKGTHGQKGRISYSHAACEGWQRATIGVYIHKGAVYWYSDLQGERALWWRAKRLVRLLAEDARELHDRLLRASRGYTWVCKGGQWAVGAID